jgi:hypothetical protein
VQLATQVLGDLPLAPRQVPATENPVELTDPRLRFDEVGSFLPVLLAFGNLLPELVGCVAAAQLLLYGTAAPVELSDHVSELRVLDGGHESSTLDVRPSLAEE